MRTKCEEILLDRSYVCDSERKGKEMAVTSTSKANVKIENPGMESRVPDTKGDNEKHTKSLISPMYNESPS